MGVLYLSFSVVFPLFFMMALGYFLRRVKAFDEVFLRQLNQLCFKVFLPTILFINVYRSDFQGIFSLKLILYGTGSVLLCFFVLLKLIPLIVKDNPKRGVVIQGIYRSNFILFGIPITASLFGAENTSITAILIAFVIPLFNGLAVVALESFTEGETNAGTIAKQVMKNPLIIASIIAFAFIIPQIKLPLLLENVISDISKIATPLALIILGASFSFKGLKYAWKELLISVAGKLIIVPAIFIPLGIWLGFRNVELVALLALFASPTAVSSYTMAQSMGGDGELAGQIVVVDSALSLVTIFLWITALKYMGVL